MSTLLARTRLGRFAGSRQPAISPLLKTGSERLDTLLLDFAAVNATLAPWPCLQRMLNSPDVERFPTPCARDQLPPLNSSDWDDRHQHRASYSQYSASHGSGADRFGSKQITRAREGTILACGTGKVIDSDQVCVQATQKARQHFGVSRVDVCVTL